MDDERTRRSARREFIRAHHPDRGGDPAVFVAGLADYDPVLASPRLRVVVVARPSRSRRLMAAAARAAGWHRPPPRVR